MNQSNLEILVEVLGTPLMSLHLLKENSSRPFIIAVAAGKGGVGKSTAAVQLALGLHKQGSRVGLLDADLYGPSIRRMLPEDELPRKKGESLIPALSHGIKVLSLAYFRPEKEAAAVRAPIANGIISQFLNQVEWGELDYFIIDFPPGTGDIQLTLAQKAHLTGAVLVTTPQEVALLDVRKAAALFNEMKVPLIGVIENMSYFSLPGSSEKHYPFGKGGGERLSKELGASLLGQIPLDPLQSQAGDEGFLIPEKTPLASIWETCTNQLIQEVNRLREPHPIRKWGLDSDHLFIEWENGSTTTHSLDKLRKACPCALCQSRPPSLPSLHQVDNVELVGRYAIKIHFVNGCRHGIYDFALLQTM